MTEDNRRYRAVVNDEEQYSIWPAEQSVPNGWTAVTEPAGREHCLDEIAALWTDIRPLSIRKATQ